MTFVNAMIWPNADLRQLDVLMPIGNERRQSEFGYSQTTTLDVPRVHHFFTLVAKTRFPSAIDTFRLGILKEQFVEK